MSIAAIAARHGLVGDAQPLGGSNVVVAIGAHVVKLFSPATAYQARAERIALALLADRLGDVAVPAVIAHGDQDGAPYLVLTRLPGATLEAAWPALDEPARCDALARIGALIARVQHVPCDPLAALGPRWDDFVAAQLAGAPARHARRGLPPHLLAQLDAYLARAAAALPRDQPAVLLTGEYTPGNLLVDARGAITGMIDLGDAWAGPADYDLIGPATFLACGDAARVRALRAGVGRAPSRDRLMALLLLHRHSDLPVQVRVAGWDRAPTIDALAELLFPI